MREITNILKQLFDGDYVTTFYEINGSFEFSNLYQAILYFKRALYNQISYVMDFDTYTHVMVAHNKVEYWEGYFKIKDTSDPYYSEVLKYDFTLRKGRYNNKVYITVWRTTY